MHLNYTAAMRANTKLADDNPETAYSKKEEAEKKETRAKNVEQNALDPKNDSAQSNRKINSFDVRLQKR